jgi:methionine-rich copper-binding protein CopC
MISKASARINLACVIALASSGGVLAHAELHHASPQAGSTVSEPPREVTLTFTDTLEAAFSSADVADSSGVRVNEGKSRELHRHGDEAGWWQKLGLNPAGAARALWLTTHPQLQPVI